MAAMIIMVLAGSLAYAAPFGSTPTVKALAGGTASVPHCQVLDFSIASSDTITSVNTNAVCDVTDSFNVNATVISGASGSGSTLVAFTTDVTEAVAVSNSSVSIGSQVYDVDINVRR